MPDPPGKVMIVDDDPEVRQLYARMLNETFDVCPIASGEEALLAIDETFDAVLLDRRMPGLSGSETLSRLRDAGWTTPISMVTAVRPDFDILEMGFDDYLLKPVELQELEAHVETLILRNEYDEVIREYVGLVSKVSALERRKQQGELAANDDYLDRKARVEELEQHARAALDTAIESGKFRELLDDRRGGSPAPDTGEGDLDSEE